MIRRKHDKNNRWVDQKRQAQKMSAGLINACHAELEKWLKRGAEKMVEKGT
jgi:23S rRNA maturation mini-RNase III